ncbi:MAG: hypothetical protein LCH39_05530 [Proteobacteria bacterium]|nr:hypothetical protein [Pseudomonadota bacterium]
MSGQETLITRKKRGPKPTGVGTMLGVRVHDPLLVSIDAWIEAQPNPKPSRPEAIRRILTAHLGKNEASEP